MNKEDQASKALKTILTLIPALNLEEAKSVMRMLEFQHPKLLAPKKLERDSALFYRAMRQFFDSQIGVGLPEARFMESSGYYPIFNRSWDMFSSYLTKLKFKDDRSKIIFYNKCFPLMVSYLKERNVQITPYSIINSVSKLPGILDQKFPGYQNLGEAGGSLLGNPKR